MHERSISECLELLELPDSFTEAQLKQAYRDLVQVWHPDRQAHNERLRVKAEEKTKALNEAFQLLESRLVDGQFEFHRPALTRTRGNEAAAPDPPSKSPGVDTAASSEPAPEPEAHVRLPEKLFPLSYIFWGVLLSLVALVLVGIYDSRRTAWRQRGSLANGPNDNSDDAWESLNALAVSPPTVLPAWPSIPAVDEHGGFKSLRFGQTLAEAEKAARPELLCTNEYLEQAIGLFTSGTMKSWADFPLDRVQSYFFRGKLFRLDLAFSSAPDQIHNTLVQQYGPPHQAGGWTRGGQAVRAECWPGERVLCALVGPQRNGDGAVWDTLVLFDRTALSAAGQYADAAPNRALQVIGEDGFGVFKFGMSFAEVRQQLGPSLRAESVGPERRAAEINERKEIQLGPYPLQRLRLEFFRDRLFKLELFFDRHQEEIFHGFMARFPSASASSSWNRGGQELAARQYSGERALAAILAPNTAAPIWDAIYLCDLPLDRARQDFERDAPKRASKEF